MVVKIKLKMRKEGLAKDGSREEEFRVSGR